MNVFHRIRCIVRGKPPGRREEVDSPEGQLVTFVSELEAQTRTLQQALVRALADERRLRMDIEDHLTESSESEKRVLLALQAGDDELARQGWREKEAHDTRAVSLQKAWRGRKAASEKLKVSLRAARQRVEDAERQCRLLLAQCNSAAACDASRESLASGGDQSPRQIIERLNETLRRIAADIDTTLERSSDPVDCDLDARLAELEQSQNGHATSEQLRALVAERDATGAATSKGPAQWHRRESVSEPTAARDGCRHRS